MSLYLRILLLTGVIPGIFFAYTLRHAGALPMRSLFVSTVLFAVFIIPVEIYMVRRGVWRFPKDRRLSSNFRLYGMPIEEYLFYFTMIPTIMLFFAYMEHLL